MSGKGHFRTVSTVRSHRIPRTQFTKSTTSSQKNTEGRRSRIILHLRAFTAITEKGRTLPELIRKPGRFHGYFTLVGMSGSRTFHGTVQNLLDLRPSVGARS